MTKKKKKEKTDNKKRSNSGKIIFGLIFVTLGLLLFFSLISFSADDLGTLQRNNMNLYKVVTLQFPDYLSNMIGPFGAYLSFAFIYLFSKLFSLFVALYFFASGLLALFSKNFHKVLRKILLLLATIIFSILFYVSVGGEFFLSGNVKAGIVFTTLINKVFFPIFSSLGSAIIFGVAIFGSVIFLIGLNNLRNILLKITEKKGEKKERKKKKTKKSRKPSISYLEKDKKKSSTPSSKKQKTIEEEAEPEQEKTLFPATDDSDYVFPDCSKILKTSKQLSQKEIAQKREKIEKNSEILRAKLNEFGVECEVTNVNVGPIITQYEVRPAPGIKISKITNLSNDLALAMKAEKIRVVAPIPGKNTIGFEVPNENSTIIRLRDVLTSEEMKKSNSPTMVALGKSITGKPFVTDLKNLRHLLIAGLTGSGKSVCLNAIITSILCRAKPEQVRFILFDPKKIELSIYEKIPHLIKEVITDPKDVLYLLNWAVKEMERRYDIFAQHNVRNITDYHNMLTNLENNATDEEEETLDKLPYIIIIVDELADLMQSLAKDIEKPLRRLSGMARAVGIYLVFATQRPSVDVVNGMIKANFPSRISFQVYSKTDSRTVLDVNGADKLLGAGDMLFSPLGKKPPIRIHGSYISTNEVKKVVKQLSQYEKPELDISLPSDKREQLNFDYDDELFPEAVKIVVKKQYASVSMLQRRFRIGYARAGRLIHHMEEAGIVGGSEGSKARKVLVKKNELSNLGF